jgi:hypothetical protein
MAPRPLVVDEPVDRAFSRPLARGVVPLLARTPLTANQVTFLAAAVGVASGVCLGLGQGVAFAALTAVFLVLDCCDGMLARLRGGGGILGRVADGVGDYVTAIAIHLGLIAWLARGLPLLEAAAWGVAAGLSMAWGAFLLDRYKRRYKGEADDLLAYEQELRAARGWRRALLASARPYMVRLANEARPADLAAYQAGARLPLRLFLLCGHSTHVTVWAVLAVLERPLEYAWIAVGPFNLLALVGLLLQRRADRAPQPPTS